MQMNKNVSKSLPCPTDFLHVRNPNFHLVFNVQRVSIHMVDWTSLLIPLLQLVLYVLSLFYRFVQILIKRYCTLP